ncbi:uncharacterized protein LOC141654856 [Silene latifolia]|uniref:uncharacterized protein LOC141654856 n=1 Tax=Silene latifolia TaxID=37657 RepID=UPI003D78A577
MEVDMKLDHKEIALKYDVDLRPLSSSGHQVSIEFILEDEGTWVIDPCDENITRPINDEEPVINAIAMVFDPSGPNGCWVQEARSCLYTMSVEPIFQDRILDDLQAYIDQAVTDVCQISHDNNNQLYIIEFTVTIKYYYVNRVVEQDMERARGMDRFSMSEIDLDRRPADDDWVWVVDRVRDEYDDVDWGMAIDALEKVDNQGLVDGSECAICIQELLKSESVVKLGSCNHAFHEGCISEWYKKQASCPLCRSVTSHFA